MMTDVVILYRTVLAREEAVEKFVNESFRIVQGASTCVDPARLIAGMDEARQRLHELATVRSSSNGFANHQA
jgi:hypothetical protein